MRKIALVFVCVMFVAGVVGAQGGPGKPDDPDWDFKTYNGNSCHPRYGSEVGDFTWFVRGLRNDSSEFREVSCPIARDDFHGIGNVLYMELVTRQSGGQKTCCTIYSFDVYGLDYIDSAYACADYDGIFRWTWPMNLETADGGYLGMSCDVPPGGWIHRYSIREAYPTDDDN